MDSRWRRSARRNGESPCVTATGATPASKAEYRSVVRGAVEGLDGVAFRPVSERSAASSVECPFEDA